MAGEMMSAAACPQWDDVELQLKYGTLGGAGRWCLV